MTVVSSNAQATRNDMVALAEPGPEAPLADLHTLLESGEQDEGWRTSVLAVLDDLARRLDAEGGAAESLHRDLVFERPWLVSRTRRFSADQAAVTAYLGAVGDLVKALPGEPTQGATLHLAVRDAVARVEAHRHRGRALVYDAHLVDLGGE